MHPGAVLSALERGRVDDGFALEVPAEWAQGRTLYGGLNAALCAHAAELALAPGAELRALQIAFIAPAAGRVRYVPTALRSGRSVTFIGVDCIAESGIASRAILSYGAAREIATGHAGPPMPDVPAPEQATPIPEIDGVPVFLRQMEWRFAGGTMPFSGGGDPAFSIWVRHRESAGLTPAAALLAVADTLPPAIWATVDLAHPRPASSITWTVDLAPPAQDPGAWYLLQSRSDQSEGGYSLQGMRCFARDGRLLAAGRQTVAIF